jgi:hypothetical protein
MLNITGGEREEHFVRAVAQFIEHKYGIHMMLFSNQPVPVWVFEAGRH